MIFKYSVVRGIPHICKLFVLPQPRPLGPTLLLTTGQYQGADSAQTATPTPSTPKEQKPVPGVEGFLVPARGLGTLGESRVGLEGGAEVAPPLDAATAVRGREPEALSRDKR